jgi:hypothetical protein
MFDLPYVWNGSKFVIDTRRNDVINKFAISLSACADSQLSMCDVGDKTGFGGSLTTGVLNMDKCLENLINGIINKNKKIIIDEYNKVDGYLKMLNQNINLCTSVILD